MCLLAYAFCHFGEHRKKFNFKKIIECARARRTDDDIHWEFGRLREKEEKS